MPTTEYNAVVDLGVDLDPEAVDALLDALADYHSAMSVSPGGAVEAIITFPAETLRQAIATALAVCAAAAGREPKAVAVAVMTTREFDARH